MTMHVIAPPPPESTPTDQLAELPMFTWARCPQHGFLGVSVLVVRGQEPTCFPHGAPAHPVDPAELGALR